MYEADQPPIPWKRHWIEQGSLSLVEIEDGFLKPPSDLRLRYSRSKVAPLKHLSALAETPCLVLLGGSGVGKSRELRSLADSSAENASVTSCYIDLKGRSDSAAIEKALRGQTGFLDWEAGRHELVLILDSLDECQRRVGEVGGIICDLLRPLIKGRPRLRLRLGCRSSEWGTDTGRLFTDLFSQQSSAANPPLGIYHLERLTREQVAEAARHRGVDTDSFLAQVDRSQLGALASHPITLDMLLAEWVKGQSLGDNRASIYSRGLRGLCEDRHQHERPSHQPYHETTPEQRFFLSARDAAMGALTDRYTFTISAEKAPSSPATTLTPDDLLGAAQPTGSIEANTRTLRETLLTGLFSSLAENVVTWAHRSYAEFLAAHHLNETLSVDQLVGVFCDTTTSTPRLYPQLEEVAAWLSELNQDFFDRLADANAEVFLRCDPHLLKPQVREKLAASYLRRLEHDDAEAAGWLTEFPLEKLAHPALCDQLRPIILNPKRSWLLRRTALEIATACNLAALAADCVPFLFSPETSDGIVSAIGDLLASAATPETRQALRERFLTFPAPSEEIIAQSFRTLWPDYLSGEELVRLLPPASKWSKDGSLRHLGNHHIPQLARADQLPALLRWVRQQGESLNDYHDFWGGLAKQRIAAQALRNLDQPAVRAEFIAIFSAQTHSSGPLLPRGDTERDPIGETAMRRLFCKSVVEESPELFAGWHQWCARENGLINSADLPWAVECLRAANDAQLRERWLNFVFMVFDETLPSVALIETIVDLLPHAAVMLAERSSWQLEQYGYPHGEKTKYHREQEEKKRHAAEPPFPVIIQRLLSEFEAGNPASMRRLLLKLDRHATEASSDTAPPKGSRPNGWSVIDATLTRRIHSTYPRYLEQITTTGLLLNDNGEESGHTDSALGCVLHLMEKDPAWFDARQAAFWQAWQRPMLLLGHHGMREPKELHARLMRKLHSAAPGNFAAALDAVLTTDSSRFFDLRLIDTPAIIDDPAVRNVLLARAQKSLPAHDLWALLLRASMPDAESWLVAASEGTETARAATASAILLVHRTETHGMRIAARMLESVDFLRAVCLALPGSGFDVRWDWGLRLPPDLTLQIWEAMEPLSPSNPYSENGGSEMTAEKALYHLRHNLISAFDVNPSPQRCAAVHALQLRRSKDAVWLGQKLVRMRKQLRAAGRPDYSPRQARDLLDLESKPRPILDEGALCARILETLSDFQKLLRDVPNPSAELWNTPVEPNFKYWYPRSEIDISDRLQHHLRTALGPLGGDVVREPETRRGHAPVNDPTDIPDLVASFPGKTGTLRVVIEVKCTWHKHAIPSLRTQLTERYLREFQCGVYCLLHFSCPTWDHPDDTRKKSGKARAELSNIERDLLSLRDALRAERPERRIEAVVIDARRNSPADAQPAQPIAPQNPHHEFAFVGKAEPSAGTKRRPLALATLRTRARDRDANPCELDPRSSESSAPTPPMPMTFSDWQSLAPDDAARLFHERVAKLSAAQRRAALATVIDRRTLADALAGTSAPLSGVPFAAKDLFDAAGLPTFAGSAFLPEVRQGHVASPDFSVPVSPTDGAFIRDVRAAGAALAAKAHMHEFAYGITGENPHYGDCEIPGHPGRTTGGSSSGSAFLVKAGVVPLALGTDTGGSIRVPSAFCGLYGFRMTPHHPWIADGFPLAESFDTPGFFTANASDLRTTLDALIPESSGSPPPAPRSSLKGAYLALPGLDPAVERAFVAAASRLADPLPASTAAALLPLFAPAAELYAILGGAETRVIHAPFYARYRDRYDANVRARIDRALTLTDADIARAQANRDAITSAWASLFSEYDYVVLPASPCPAATKAECTVETRNRILSLTVPASMASLPVLALPVALPDTGGLTTGLQIVVPSIQSPAIRHALALHG